MIADYMPIVWQLIRNWSTIISVEEKWLLWSLRSQVCCKQIRRKGVASSVGPRQKEKWTSPYFIFMMRDLQSGLFDKLYSLESSQYVTSNEHHRDQI